MSYVEELNELFSLDDWLSFETHPSGLILGRVKTPVCYAEFLLYGAHVLSYRPVGQPSSILFLSDQVIFERGKPIRGGIPICFPWFGSHEKDPSLPAHGWARTQEWEVIETAQADNRVIVRLLLSQDGFEVTCELSFGTELSLDLDVLNSSSGAQSFEVALHTYFQISSIDDVEILGLEGIPFFDQLKNRTEHGSADVIRFTEETDRIYQGCAERITLSERNRELKIVTVPRGAKSTIVWNPWVDKSKRMVDFGDDEYTRMCCIETANVRANRIELESGQSHTTGLTIRTI